MRIISTFVVTSLIMLVIEASAQEAYAVRTDRLGSHDGPDALGADSGVAMSASRFLYVLDHQAKRVLVFDPEGNLAFSFGRRGGGPGEFLNPRGLGVRDNEIWVYDFAQSRHTYFSMDGLLLRTVAVPMIRRADIDWNYSLIHHFGHHYLAVAKRPIHYVSTRQVDQWKFLLLDQSLTVIDTLLNITVQHPAYFTISRGEFPTVVTQVVRAFPLYAFSPGLDRLLVVERNPPDGDNGTFRIRVFDDNGFQQLDQEVGFVAHGITNAWFRQRLDQVFASGFSMVSRSEYESRMWRPSHHPPISHILHGADNSIWIGREPISDSTLLWQVFDHTGTYLFTVGLPAGFRPYWATVREVLGVTLDEFDVSFVERYRIYIREDHQ